MRIGRISGTSFQKSMARNWDLYLILTPVLAYFLIFKYGPMYGVQIAFKDYLPVKGIWSSPWVGLEHFVRLFKSYYFSRLLTNTLSVSALMLLFGFPIPIILALMITELNNRVFRKSLQMVTYAPHFLSIVIVVGMLTVFLSPSAGLINVFIKKLGGKAVFFMAKPELFRPLYVISGIWQNAGWGSIIYIATISSIDPELYEAAYVDGATKIQRLANITIPGILPTAVILLIMNTGRIMDVGFHKVFLMQNSMNIEKAEVISTYVYKAGLLEAQFSFSAAVGLFNSIINCLLLVAVNGIARKVNETSLF